MDDCFDSTEVERAQTDHLRVLELREPALEFRRLRLPELLPRLISAGAALLTHDSARLISLPALSALGSTRPREGVGRGGCNEIGEMGGGTEGEKNGQ